MLANSLLALMWMLIAFIVLMAKPDGKIQKMFYTIGIATVFISVQSFLPRIVTMEVIQTSPKLFLLAAL